MKISIIANTAKNSESFGFIRPIAELNYIEKIYVFGKGSLEKHPNVEYVKDIVKKPKNLQLILRQIQVITRSRKSEIIIGIYEIPHGFIALIGGLVLRKKTILCVIGNPANSSIRKGIRLWLLNFMIKKMTATTVTGTNSKFFFVKNGHNANKLFILPNTIDVNIFKSKKYERKYDIISLSRLSPEKELINLLKIILVLKNDFTDIRVGIAGKGPEYEKLNNFIIINGLVKNVSLLGYIEDKISFYNSGIIFLLTSSTEGLPRTVIESMSCGTPCVVSNVGDIPDLVEDGKNGFIIENYNDIERYVLKIKKLLSDNKLRDEFSKNAIENVHEKYSHITATIFWEKLFNKLRVK